jgi:diaminopimelate decarboxylase
MDHFDYRNGELCAEDVPISRIAADVGTPFYCYSTATLERHYRVFADAFAGTDALICYSLKSNGNLAVVRTLAEQGAGADIVSEGELRRALASGIPPERIVFSGVGKRGDEMRAALDVGIHQFNVESLPELHALNDIALAAGTRAPVALRINPDVDAGSHHKISTGREQDKFGIPWAETRAAYAAASQMAGISVVGIDVHIGSQLSSLAPFEAAFRKVAEMVEVLRSDGHDIRRMDLGGGLGVPYHETDEAPPPPAMYADLIKRIAGHLGCQIVLEPGRLISANAGVLVSSVVYVKNSGNRTFVILDGAMNDLVRPAMYDAYHRVLPVAEPSADAPQAPVDLVGPVCETGDTFARARMMPLLSADDLVVFCTAGAYGAVMSSTYNTRPLVPEVLVKGDDYAIVRRRPSLDEMLAAEEVPDWLTS